MHKIHITDGVVLGRRAVGEGSVRVAILTRELGLLRARAQSARAEKSKLRYGLETLTHARFNFVKGKNEWRLTGAEGAQKLLSPAAAARAAAGRVATLLLRLVPGQEHTPELFETTLQGLQTLARTGEREQVEAIETVLVLRVLATLGYLPHTPELAPFIETDFASLELAQAALRQRRLPIRAINESLLATGL